MNTVTLVSSGIEVGNSDGVSTTLPTVNRYVPNYPANPEATANSESTSNSESSTPPKRKVKVRRYSTPAPVPRTEVCWVISKKCCYEAVQKGYKCKDYYVYKYARCHPVIEYEQICGEITEQPKEHSKPAGRALFEESIIKNYDSRYGPHVAGYPAEGESEFYDTPVIPQRPHGVKTEPFDPPQTAVNRPAGSWDEEKGSKTYEEGQKAAGGQNNGNMVGTAGESGGGGYVAQPAPSTSAPATTPTKQYVPPSQVNNNANAGTGSNGPSEDAKITYVGNAPRDSNPPVAAVDTPVQAGGTYRFVEPVEETLQ